MANIIKGKYKSYDTVMEALDARRDWERRIAQLHAQYYGLDRPDVMNYPWPGASSNRYLLAQMTIAKMLPIRNKLIHSSKNIVTMISKKKDLISKAPLMSQYFDFYTKQRTDFERQIQYSGWNQMQNGLCVMKSYYDTVKKRTVDEDIPPIFFIVPSDCHDVHESPWCVHIIQKSHDWVKKRFEGTADKQALASFLSKQESGDYAPDESDSGQSEKHKYDRMGISRSKARTRNITLWERHFRDKENTLMMEYIIPDNPGLKVCEPFGYPYESMVKADEYMFETSKYEEVNAHFYSAQGITEKATETEFSITAMWRAKLNTLQLFSSPVFYPMTPDSIPSTTQNLDFSPGSILPGGLQKVDMGEVPVEFMEEINFERGVFEQWIGRPDYGLGKANTLGEARTATEVKAIAFQSSLNSEADLNNWKRFIGAIAKKRLGLLNEFKDEIKDWEFLTKEGFDQFDKSFISDDYFIEVNGSADSLNREAQLNNAIALFNLGLQAGPAGQANIPELFKNVVENAEPERVERFVLQSGQAEAEAARSALQDMTSILVTGQMIPSQVGDPLAKAQVAVQTLQNLMKTGQALPPQILGQISQYIAKNREQLKQTNKQGYQQITAMLDQLDQASHAAMGGQPQIPQQQAA
jgi:hypothetical protein